MSIKHDFHDRLTTSHCSYFVTFDLPCDMQKGPSCRRTKPLPHCLSMQLTELLLPSLVPALSLKCSAEHIQGKEANLFAEAERQQQHSRPPPRYLPSQPLWGCCHGNQMQWGTAQPTWETAQGPRNQSASAKWEIQTRIYDGICWN